MGLKRRRLQTATFSPAVELEYIRHRWPRAVGVKAFIPKQSALKPSGRFEIALRVLQR
jgi:hypothetical protein